MALKINKTELDGVLIIEPNVFNDQRGYFFETYQRQRYADAGIRVNFVQDNLSFSKKWTIRLEVFVYYRPLIISVRISKAFI